MGRRFESDGPGAGASPNPEHEAICVVYPFFLTRWLARSGLARHLPAVQRRTHGGAAVVHHYSDRVLAAPVDQLTALAGTLEVEGPDAINLALAAPRLDVVPSASTKLPADRRGWPDARGQIELRSAVAARLQQDSSIVVDPATEVLVTHGASGAFGAVADAFLNAGDRVTVFAPTSPLYALTLTARRARVRWVPTWVENGRLRFRLDHLAKALQWSRLLVVVSPHNPTGGVIAAEDLEHVAWWADRKDALIISDESFASYSYDGPPPSIASVSRAAARTLVIGSISQAYGIASARVGWVAGRRHLVGPCAVAAAVHTPFVPTVCQQIALAALAQPPEIPRAVRDELESRRRYAFDRLRGMGLEPAWPAGGYFLWVPVAACGLGGRAFAERLLREKRVLVSPGDLFGPGGEGHIRLSFAAEDGRLREGLSRLGDFVRSLKNAPPPRLAQAA